MGDVKEKIKTGLGEKFDRYLEASLDHQDQRNEWGRIQREWHGRDQIKYFAEDNPSQISAIINVLIDHAQGEGIGRSGLFDVAIDLFKGQDYETVVHPAIVRIVTELDKSFDYTYLSYFDSQDFRSLRKEGGADQRIDDLVDKLFESKDPQAIESLSSLFYNFFRVSQSFEELENTKVGIVSRLKEIGHDPLLQSQALAVLVNVFKVTEELFKRSYRRESADDERATLQGLLGCSQHFNDAVLTEAVWGVVKSLTDPEKLGDRIRDEEKIMSLLIEAGEYQLLGNKSHIIVAFDAVIKAQRQVVRARYELSEAKALHAAVFSSRADQPT